MEPTVRALVGPRRRAPDPRLVEAVERQTRAPDEVLIGSPAGHHPIEGAASWFWLLEGSALPEPQALEELLGALERLGPLPSPVLLASAVLDTRGRPHPAALPVPRLVDPDLTAAAFERHLVPLRIARPGSLLVHRRGIEAGGLPTRRRDRLVWSARLLKEEPGFLVSASVAIGSELGERAAARSARLELLAWARLLASGAVTRRERGLFGFRMAEAALAHLRGRP